MLQKMETLSKLLILVAIALWMCSYQIEKESDRVEEYSRRLRGERDMYQSLYRSANTKLAHFQDSINIHCICK